MPIKLSDLNSNRRTVEFDWNGNDVHIEYRPSAITPIFQSRVFKMDTKDSMNIVDAVCTMLTGWDVLGDDGNPIEITANILGSFPIEFVTRIVEVVFKDIKPGTPDEKKPSGGGSSTATCRRRKKKP
jgi:hypothetical protein